jgi:hypothetical protein
MTRTAFPQASWRLLLWAGLFAVLHQGCERIDPITADPASSGEAVALTCESCHTNAAYLRLLALEEAVSESAGGG